MPSFSFSDILDIGGEFRGISRNAALQGSVCNEIVFSKILFREARVNALGCDVSYWNGPNQQYPRGVDWKVAHDQGGLVFGFARACAGWLTA